MSTILLPELKMVMACSPADRCSLSWYQGKGASYLSCPNSLSSNSSKAPSHQPTAAAMKAILCPAHTLQLSQFPMREK